VSVRLSRPTRRRPIRGREPDDHYGLLLGAVISAVAVQGMLSPGPVQQVAASGLLGAALVLAFRVARASPRLMRLAVGLACVGVAVALLHALTGVIGEGEARLMNAVLVVFGPPAVGLGVIRTLQASEAVRIEAVTGVLSLYMLIGLLFAFVYGAIDHLGGDPFFASGSPATVAKCIYFSFTTLTTAGYGDLTARSDFGHTLSIFEALLGQIYLVTVVSLIVTNLGRQDRPGRI
jgi:Ion channel